MTTEVKTKLVIQFHNDPAHGWYKVGMNIIEGLKIRNKISPYSYMRYDTAYLEEDCDMQVLIDALDNIGIAWEVADKDVYYHEVESNPIRSMDSFK